MNSMSLRHVKFHDVRLHRAARFSSSHSLRVPQIFKISDEVQEAVLSGKPVVALETTIYTHGFPYPDNVALASHLESVVRMNGGVPATIGVLHGVARVGLSPEELIELASAAGKKETMKISRRDLPYITGLVGFRKTERFWKPRLN
jgi:pseudouridine-5'-phosphate glycosidase/pseudouridine kinase